MSFPTLEILYLFPVHSQLVCLTKKIYIKSHLFSFFLSDNIVAETFNVGEFNVNSFDGLRINTTAGFNFDGSSVDGRNVGAVDFSTTDPDSIFSITAATSIDLSGGDYTFKYVAVKNFIVLCLTKFCFNL